MFQLFEIGFSTLFSWEPLLLMVVGGVSVVVTVIADRVVRRGISRYSRRINLEKHAENILRLLARLVIVALGLVFLLQHLGVGGGVVCGALRPHRGSYRLCLHPDGGKLPGWTVHHDF